MKHHGSLCNQNPVRMMRLFLLLVVATMAGQANEARADAAPIGPELADSFKAPQWSADAIDCDAVAGQSMPEVRLVHVWAKWCPVCLQQDRQLERLSIEEISYDRVDYSDTRTRERYDANYPSTLILFQGNTEVWRHAGSIDDDELSLVLSEFSCSEVK